MRWKNNIERKKKNEASCCLLPIIPLTHNPAAIQLQRLEKPAGTGLDWATDCAVGQTLSLVSVVAAVKSAE